MKIRIKNNVRRLVGVLPFYLLALTPLFFTSCSEEDDSIEEYPNWQATNEAYFNQLFAQTQQRVAAGDASWRLLRKWSLQDSLQAASTDYVVVHALATGEGTELPLFTDSVRVMYSARLLPSTTYTSGRVFAKTFVGDELDPQTAYATLLGVSSTSTVDGLATALQHMHVGDRWQIYVPYTLGYGTAATTVNNISIPAYSTLVYDVSLVAIYHPDDDIPTFQTKSHNGGLDVGQE